MLIILYLLILILGSASYITALTNIYKGKYRPNVFSRAVWSLLAINSFAGVLASNSSAGSALLAAVLTLGSVAVFIASLTNGTRTFGKLELICTFLLVGSGVIWIVFDEPLLNVAISLSAHFIGGIPTYRQVWKNPKSESKKFWGLFFAASFTSVVASLGNPAFKQLVPLYYTLFDGSILLLCFRKRKN